MENTPILSIFLDALSDGFFISYLKQPNSSRIVLPELEKSLDDAKIIGNLFIRRKDDLKVKYGKFCINQPKAEFIITEFEAFFNVSHAIHNCLLALLQL